MSDLISRSELLKQLATEPKYSISVPKGFEALKDLITYHHEKVIEVIEGMPTAYDVDKVVEGLEATKETACELLKIPKFLKKDLQELVNMCFDEAIEIVKQDGVSDDVCEWHKVKNGNAYKCHTHAEIHDSRVLDWCVCPYCSKKIKVVE